MAELSSCCSAEAQQSCCAPEAKSECCDQSAEGSRCGCSAGQAESRDVQQAVRDRYAAAALAVRQANPASCSCGNVEEQIEGETFGAALYSTDEQDALPDEAKLASLGCGNPTAVAELHEGETVLDLGSGGGIDVLLSARRVGPAGEAYGVDMTDEMLELARSNAAKAGAANVEFLKGTIEEVPLQDQSVDVVISNCVINLSVDKPRVLAERFRVLTPGRRIGIS